jgi:hypothetical protein
MWKSVHRANRVNIERAFACVMPALSQKTQPSILASTRQDSECEQCSGTGLTHYRAKVFHLIVGTHSPTGVFQHEQI